MITVILINIAQETRIRRYDTNSFDEAAIALVDDWIEGQIIWNYDGTNEKLDAEYMQKWGYPTQDCVPEIDRENEVYTVSWYGCGASESDDEIVTGYFIKSAPVEEGEWPTRGLA